MVPFIGGCMDVEKIKILIDDLRRLSRMASGMADNLEEAVFIYGDWAEDDVAWLAEHGLPSLRSVVDNLYRLLDIGG
jgi:hypothetical protein